MKLFQGEQAKEFKVKDIHKQEISLSQYEGKKLLLSFYRNVACPFCNLRVHQLTKLAVQLRDQGLEMVFFFETPTRHILRSTFHNDLSPIPIVGDPDKEIYKLYGVETSVMKSINSLFKKGFKSQLKEAKELGLDKVEDGGKVSKIIPADFLIKEQQKVVQAYYGAYINDHLPLDNILNYAKSGLVQSN
ncbi:MAG: redoxin domain-containing protein [Thermonemataceae bacterium]